MTIYKIKAGRVPDISFDTGFIGNADTLFYDTVTGDLRISDGETPGGVPLTFNNIVINLQNLSDLSIPGGTNGQVLGTDGNGTLSWINRGIQGYAGSQGYVGSYGYTGSIGYSGSSGSFGGMGYTGSLGYTGSKANEQQLIIDIATATGDIQGIVNKDDSAITVNDATREITVSPTGSSWDYYYHGELHTISTPKTLAITNTDGPRYISINPANEQLVEGGAVPNFTNDVIIAYLYWSVADQKFIIVGDERHGSKRDTTWHGAQHLNVGTVWRSGGLPSFALNDDNNVNISLSTPINMADEDLLHVVNNSATPSADYEQILSPTASLEVLYLDGSHYRSIPASTNFWVAGTSLARYNPVVNGSGSLADADEGSFITYWLIGTNDIRSPIKMVLGRQKHATLDAAYAEEFQEYGLSFAEQVFMYQFVVQTNTGYVGNAAKIQIVDVRKITSKVATSASLVSAAEHNQLTGRDNLDAHPISAITDLQTTLTGKQDVLVSGTNIKTINSTNILGSGNITITGYTGSMGYTGSQSYIQPFTQYQSSISNGGTVNLDASTGNIFYVNTGTVSGNWTANIQNSTITTNYYTSITIIIEQGASAFIPTVLNVNGTNNVTINWTGTSQPTPNPNKKDVITFNILQTGAGAYTAFGQLVSFG